MITVLMGCPAAGKSTWVEQNKAGDEYIYTADAIRMNRDIDVNHYMNWIRGKASIEASKGRSIIADATHTIDIHRRFWLRLASKYNQDKRLVVLDTGLKTALLQNVGRQYPAPSKIVIQHWKRCQNALSKIDSEGWDSIEIVRRGY